MENHLMKDKKIIFSAPLTHSDWHIHEDGPEWGENGVRYMLGKCRDFGFTKILWRVFDSGKATYASKLVEPFKWDEHEEIYHYSPGYIDLPPRHIMDRMEQTDYYSFDSLEAALRIGHELGMRIDAWISINEDDHGFGYTSRFTRQHPEYRWTRRNGDKFHSQLSFAFKEVRNYKLELVREVLEYDIDGIFIDWIRTGDIRDNPQNDGDGIADYGYEKPNVDIFVEKYGIDPHDVGNGDDRWVACRAEPLTGFMREVRKIVNLHSRNIPLAVMVQHPWSYRGVLPEMIKDEMPGWVKRMSGNRIDGSLKGLLCDVHTWAEEKLIDEIVAAGYYTGGGDQEKAYRYLEAETGGKIPIWQYNWVPKQKEDFVRDLVLAEKLGTKEMLFWEADYIDTRPEPQRTEIINAIMEYKNR
jgi:Uncharacterized protein conserved in bacteria